MGIQAVQERLKTAGDGKPRLFIMEDSLLEPDDDLAEKHLPLWAKDEFPAYVWADHATKEIPIKENDHSMDALRYAVMYVDHGRISMKGLPQDTSTKSKWAIGERAEAPSWSIH